MYKRQDYTPLVDALIGMGAGTPWALDRVILFGQVWEHPMNPTSHVQIAMILGRLDSVQMSKEDLKSARKEFNSRIGALWHRDDSGWLKCLSASFRDLLTIEEDCNFPIGYWGSLASHGCVLYSNLGMIAVRRAAREKAPSCDEAKSRMIQQDRKWAIHSIRKAMEPKTTEFLHDGEEICEVDKPPSQVAYDAYEGACRLLHAELLSHDKSPWHSPTLWNLTGMVETLGAVDPRMKDIVLLIGDLPDYFTNVWDNDAACAQSITNEEANKACGAAERIAAVLDVNLEQCSSNPAKTVATKLSEAFIPSRPANVKEWLNQRATEIGGNQGKESTASTCEPAIDVEGLAECLGRQRIRLKQSDAIELINMLSEEQQSQILSKLAGKNSPAGNQIGDLIEQNGVKPTDSALDSHR